MSLTVTFSNCYVIMKSVILLNVVALYVHYILFSNCQLLLPMTSFFGSNVKKCHITNLHDLGVCKFVVGRHDIQHNDIQHNDTKDDGTQHNNTLSLC